MVIFHKFQSWTGFPEAYGITAEAELIAPNGGELELVTFVVFNKEGTICVGTNKIALHFPTLLTP